MAEINFFPIIGRTYTADDYNWINKDFTVNGKSYKFVKFASGKIYRPYSPVQVDADGLATQTGVYATGTIDGFTVDWVDAFSAAVYTTIVVAGEDIKAQIVGQPESSAYQNAVMVPWQNGQIRAANAALVLGAGLNKGATASCVLTLGATASQNYTSFVVEGDLVKTNMSAWGVVGSVVNASSLTLAFSAQGVTNDTSYQATMVYANYGAARSKWVGSSANYIQYKVNSQNIPASISVNVSTASTVFTANTAITGTMVKVGDLITIAGDTAASTRYVTSINNANSFTVNAAATAESTGLIGTYLNICTWTFLVKTKY